MLNCWRAKEKRKEEGLQRKLTWTFLFWLFGLLTLTNFFDKQDAQLDEFSDPTFHSAGWKFNGSCVFCRIFYFIWCEMLQAGKISVKLHFLNGRLGPQVTRKCWKPWTVLPGVYTDSIRLAAKYDRHIVNSWSSPQPFYRSCLGHWWSSGTMVKWCTQTPLYSRVTEYNGQMLNLLQLLTI